MTVLGWQRGGSAGGPAVVLIHDWASDGGSWQDAGWVQGLAAFDVLTCDLPGHGDSADIEIPLGREPGAWTASAVLSDLVHLHVSRVAVVGTGVGAVVAGHLAVKDTTVVTRAVLIGCDDGPLVPYADEVAAALRSSEASLWRPDAAAAVAKAREARNADTLTLARWAESVAWPAAARLGSLRAPVLLAVGRDDARHERVPRLASLFHDGRLVTVPGDAETALASPKLVSTVARFLGEG